MRLAPVTREEARKFIAQFHRHSSAPDRWICCVGLEHDGDLVGVGTLERPKARRLCDGETVEASRVCCKGETRNGCSMLYGALCRAAAALGYRRIVTYTLSTEPGSSVKAAGFREDSTVKAETWGRRRVAAAGYQADMWDDRRYGQEYARVRWSKALK